MKNRLEKKLHEIATAVFDAIERKALPDEDLGLFSGRMGTIFFCEHYLRAFPDPRRAMLLEKYLDSFFDRLTAGMSSLTYCSGLTGVLDGLNALNRERVLEVDFSDIISNYRKTLYDFAEINLARTNYDYLHGALGIVGFFQDDPVFVNRILELLDGTAEKEGPIYKWKSRLGMEEKYGYNISLSHGMASIVSVLCGLTAPEIDRAKRNELIAGACNYLLSQQIDPRKYGCRFPSQSLENEPEQEPYCSRLAWCYGDLGVATSLWQAGKTLHEEAWKEKALEVFVFASGRRSRQQSMVMDAGLCHGTGSIAMMFRYMHRQTGEALLAETADFWLEHTLEMSRFEDGAAGYKIWHGLDRSWTTEYNLLEGVAGIGLLFLSALNRGGNEEEWMRFFLLG